LAILFISDNLVESLAEADWDEKDRNAIVASIANITITTISSTSVKAFIFLCIIVKKYKLIRGSRRHEVSIPSCSSFCESEFVHISFESSLSSY
jgi:hypothetical protein